MRNIRLGKTIVMRWKVTTNGTNASLSDRNLQVVLTNNRGKSKALDYDVVENNVIVATLQGKDNTVTGMYILTLWENRNGLNQSVVDIDAFNIVRRSEEEDDDMETEGLDVDVIELATANIEIIGSMGGVTDYNDLKNKPTADDIKYDSLLTTHKAGSIGAKLKELEAKSGVTEEQAAEIAKIAEKQDAISDLDNIRSGASKGATALQPVAGKGLSTNDYTDDDKAEVAKVSALSQKVGDLDTAVEQGVTAASNSASAAEAKATEAASLYGGILDAMGSLPDGEAVSAQVAVNSGKLAVLDAEINGKTPDYAEQTTEIKSSSYFTTELPYTIPAGTKILSVIVNNVNTGTVYDWIYGKADNEESGYDTLVAGFVTTRDIKYLKNYNVGVGGNVTIICDFETTGLKNDVLKIAQKVAGIETNLESKAEHYEVDELNTLVGKNSHYKLLYEGDKTLTASYQNLNIPTPSVKKGDKVKISISLPTNDASLSVRARINGSTKTLYEITENDEREYTAPEDVEYFVIVSSAVYVRPTTYSISLSQFTNATGLVNRVEAVDNRLTKIEEGESGNSRMCESLLGNDGVRLFKDTFVNGESMASDKFPYYNRFGNQVSLTAKVTMFDTLKIYCGNGSYGYKYFTIDNTNIYISDGSKVLETKAHGLTISGYISLNLNFRGNGNLRVNVVSVGGIMTIDNKQYYDFIKWDYAAGKIELVNEGCSLNTVQFCMTNNMFRCPFWIFGASQEGFAANRWLGQLMQIGYSNYLANALSGRSSVGNLDDLKRALNFGCPKYVYFALSNDGYDYNTYKGRMDAAKAVADEYGFEIIFVCKSVTPSTKATYEEQLTKRNTVIDYGCRYFDFGKAVAADPTDPNTMYPNHLGEGDEWVHPVSALGAKAIAMQFIVDVPEIMQYQGSSYNASGEASQNEPVG